MLEQWWGGIWGVPIRKIIAVLGAVVALITAVCPPVSFAVNGYLRNRAYVAFKAETAAGRAATFVHDNGTGWQLNAESLAEASGIRARNVTPLTQRVRTNAGSVVTENAAILSAPTTRVAWPIVVDGRRVGSVEVIGSLQPLLIEVAFLSLITLALGVGAYFAFAVLPLKALDRSMGALEEANARFRQQNLVLDTALTNMHQGLAMFDADERLVFANDRFAALYSMRPEQLAAGTTLRQLAEHRVAAGLYVGLTVEEFLATVRRTVASGAVSHITRKLGDGRTVVVTVRPRPDGGWVTSHEDVTVHERLNARLGEQNEQLRQQEKALKRQNLILDAALETMSQGLCMFDADQRVVICNSQYAELYGLHPEHVRPGVSLREIVELRIANGLYVGSAPEEYLRERTAPVLTASNSIHELSDGRSIAIARRPTPGGGWVTTHEDISEHRRKEARIAHMAHHDALTDLPNRILMNERLELALARAGQGGTSACHLLDLDDFKNVNDTLGHPAGDKLLRQVSERLRALVRDADTVARMGGDEFAILQTGQPQPADAVHLAQRVIEAVGRPYDIDGHQVVIGTSIGIAMAPSDGTTADDLIRNADLALYRAKDEGRGTFCFFEPEMDGAIQARRAMETDLRKAHVSSQFELLYQPVVDLTSDEISGLEALIRWQHPTKGLVPPSEFITLAEEMGLIEPISEWVLRQACARAAKWPGDIRIAVNLSSAQFRRPGLVAMVVSALAASGLNPERLELEITETSLLQNSEATLATLYQLRDLGVRIAMDDFGTGYSSLSYLQSFPFDKIKIDRSFIKDITDGVGSLNIVRAITAMARGLGMTTTAEGVETPEQLAAVKAEGCTEMQGYLFSAPVSADQIERLLEKRGVGKKGVAA